MQGNVAILLAIAALGCVSVGSRPAPPPPPEPIALSIPPGVVIDASDTTYQVDGTSAAEIGQSLRDRTPVGAGAFRHHGSHRYNIRWSYRTKMVASQCLTEAIAVTITSRITLPKWEPAPLASRGLRAQWQDYHTALTRHELGHRAISVAGAIGVRNAIARLTAERCDEIALLVRAESRRILEETGEANARYDVTTDHGASQGAYWSSR